MRQAFKYKNSSFKALTIALIAVLGVVLYTPEAVSAANVYCGDGESKVKISFDIGCKGEGGGIENPITDAAFAIIRFLTVGVGLIIVGSLIVAGIQYTTSRGDPQATAAAISRIKSNITAFLIYVFSFALLNYLIPRGFIG